MKLLLSSLTFFLISYEYELKYTTFSCLTRLGCQQGWVLHGDSCYQFLDTPTPKWSDAPTTCQYEGDLAITRSEDENNFILGLLNNTKTVRIESAWLGLNRKPSAGNAFYWIDVTPLPRTGGSVG